MLIKHAMNQICMQYNYLYIYIYDQVEINMKSRFSRDGLS